MLLEKNYKKGVECRKDIMPDLSQYLNYRTSANTFLKRKPINGSIKSGEK